MTTKAKAPGKYQIMPPPAPEEREALRSSIQTHGVLNPPLVDEDGEIIDGHTRQEIADELGLPCPSKVLSGLSDDDKIGLAIDLNWTARRNLTPEQKQALVLGLRARGWSTRRIAGQTHISQSAVDRYIKTDTGNRGGDPPGSPEGEQVTGSDESSGEPSGSPEPEPVTEPQTVQGRDGKTYRARRPASSKPKAPRGNRTVEDGQEQVETETRVMNLMNERRAFLFMWGKRCYVLLVANGQVVKSVEQLDPSDRLAFNTWLRKKDYDPYWEAWYVGTRKDRIGEFMDALDGEGRAVQMSFFGKPNLWPHNDPTVTARPPELLDIVFMLLAAASPGWREKLAAAIFAAVHSDGDERKYRPVDVDELFYLMGDVQKFVHSTADQESLWTLLRQGWSVRTPPARDS